MTGVQTCALPIYYGIPANDDAIRSVRLLADFIADAVIAGSGAEVTVAEMADGAVVAEVETAPVETAADAAADAATEAAVAAVEEGPKDVEASETFAE